MSHKSVFETFAYLLMHEKPSTESEFEDLPEIMQLILDRPDSLENLAKIVEIKRRESSFVPAVEIMIADILLRNQSQVKFSWPESVIKAVGRHDYLCGTSEPTSALKTKLLRRPEREQANCEELSWILHVLNMVIG